MRVRTSVSGIIVKWIVPQPHLHGKQRQKSPQRKPEEVAVKEGETPGERAVPKDNGKNFKEFHSSVQPRTDDSYPPLRPLVLEHILEQRLCRQGWVPVPTLSLSKSLR